MKNVSSKVAEACVLSLSLLCLLPSCGTQIQMTEAVPAKVNLGRDTTMYINGNSDGDRGIAAAIRDKLAADGYYKLPGQGGSIRSAYMVISGTGVEIDKPTGIPLLSSTIDISNGNQNVYHRNYANALTNNEGSALRAVDTISRTVVHDISPHEKNLYVRVRGSKENPSVELGAKACAAGNWEQGEVYAKEALQQKPDDPEALFLMGVIERKKMNYAQSTAYFTKADTIKPSGKYKKAISKNKVMEQNDKYTMQQLAGE